MSVLKDFYHGRIHPFEDLNGKAPEAEYKTYREKIEAEKERWLRKKLSEEDYDHFNEVLQPLFWDIGCYWEERGFTYGFKLGATIMIDVLTGNK